MSTLAAALKVEIRRLARKEIKAETGSTSRAVTQYRREIARLKRDLRDQAKKIAFLESQAREQLGARAAASSSNGEARFSARSVKAQRRKSGLSAADYAMLVGVSALTIYNWEQQKSRPRREQLAALVALRGIGKREAQAKLKLLKAGDGKTATRRPRRKKTAAT